MKLSTGAYSKGRVGSIVGVVLMASAFLMVACAGSTPAEQPMLDLTENYRIGVQTFDAEATGAAAAAEPQGVGPPTTNTPLRWSILSLADEPPPGNPPEEILTLERKGYDFQWQVDHWASRSMNMGSVFYFYPYGLGVLEPGFGFTSINDLSETAINPARRDFFSAFGLDVGADIWMLQLGEIPRSLISPCE